MWRPCAVRWGSTHRSILGHSAGGFVALHLALRHPGVAGGLFLCDTAATLASVPDDDPPPSLSERAGNEAVAAAGRLFGGDFSTASQDAFARLVAPTYAAPGHEDIPGRLLALSSLNGAVARHFFDELAAGYDLRPHLAAIDVPTLVMVGAYDWVCPPVASRLLAQGIPEVELIVVDDAGHFAFSEAPGDFLAAVRRLLARMRTATASRA